MSAPNAYLTPEDFAKVFNDTLGALTISKINEYAFAYRSFTKEERDYWLCFILKTMFSPNILKAGKERLDQWEHGWGENLKILSKENLLHEIIPRYFGKYNIVRWRQEFIKPLEKDFEQHMLAVIEYWLFEKYFKEMSAVYEFGCGTGHNLLRLREVNAGADLYGLDWTRASQKIIEKLSHEGVLSNTAGYNFDFFNPDYSLILDKDSGVYTVAALEQIGGRFKDFIDYLIQNKPRFCVHIEPVGELLDADHLLDYLSIQYFKKRNYLSGFLDHLKVLEAKGKVTIHKAQRTYIGSLFIDGYSVIIWSPK